MSYKKPEWLKKKIDFRDIGETGRILKRHGLNTVCNEAACPNIGECFARKTATFLILGKNCTRGCLFCNVERLPPGSVDRTEPERVADCVFEMGLSHTVVTSVTRDDLADGGCEAFVRTAEKIREKNRKTSLELLIPDFGGNDTALFSVTDTEPEILAHNIETVSRLYFLRKGADYKRSISLLSKAKKRMKKGKIKSSLLLGMGESKEEVIETVRELSDTGLDFLCMGQYLAPSKKHFPVKEYIEPGVFEELKEKAGLMGIPHVLSGPYVRSSYLAGVSRE